MISLPKFAIYWARAVILAFFVACLVFVPARADVAPPQSPPGANIVPDTDITQVRMLSEVVMLTVLPRPSEGHRDQARTEATFLMRNLGTNTENLEVRFPLTFFDESSNGFGKFPEITEIQVTVNGESVTPRRIESSFLRGVAYSQSPWAAFDVTFPPGQDVSIGVKYTVDGFGYEPFVTFRYVLQTGTGWKDTIGTADIAVRLPYSVNNQNVLLDETARITPGSQMSGNEVSWHFENLEPVADNDITISLLSPSLWQKVLDERANTLKNPKDGETWGRLSKACKEAVRYRKLGSLRSDPAGLELYREAVAAYEKTLDLLPKDAQWHYGFADLLWSHILSGRADDYSEFSRLAQELRISLILDPKNKEARELARQVSGMFPRIISETNGDFDYLVLTATPGYTPPAATKTPLPKATFTPLPSSPTPEPTSTLSLPKPTAMVMATDTIPAATSIPVKTPASGAPFCGGTALVLPLLAGLLWAFSRRR